MKKGMKLSVLLLMLVALVLIVAACGKVEGPSTSKEPTTFTVTFKAGDGEVLKTETVELGQAATAPAEIPERTGYEFTGWDTEFTNVQADIVVTAQYIRLWTVTFADDNGDAIEVVTVRDGAAATAPEAPAKENYTFSGWDKAFDAVAEDMTVTATYTENDKFTVTFQDHDGATLKTETVYVGKDATAPEAPSHEHFTFTAWDKAFTNIQADTVVTAQCTEDAKFTVTFKDHDGSTLKTETVYVGEDATAPEAPAHEHFTFTAWDKAFTNIQADTVVTAQCTEDAKFTVTFKGWDGTTLKTEVVYQGEDATAPEAPEKDNYTFAAWDQAFTNVQADVVVTATYTENAKYTVTFKDYDGTTLKTEVVYVGKAATAPAAPTRENHTFEEWDKAFTNVQGDLTVTAVYRENGKLLVKFVDHDGAILKSESVYAGMSATAPADPTRDNYTFTGWDKTFANITEDTTITATYRENPKYTVTFKDHDGAILKTEVVYEGKAATAPADPTRDNYTFTGWDKTFASITAETTVTATYRENPKYTVTFKDHDGTTLKTETVYQGKGATAPATPVHDHFTFTAWDKAFTDIQADTVVTAQCTEDAKFTVTFKDHDGATLKTEVVYIGEDATAPEAPAHTGYRFTAWDKAYTDIRAETVVTAQCVKTYVVTFKDHDGTTLKTQTVDENTAATAPATPPREGYVLTGWDKTFTSVTADMTVTAQYEIVKYNVIFKVPGVATAPDTQVIEHGGTATKPEDPVRDGFDFIEWRVGGAAYDFTTPVKSDLTVTAYFKSNGKVPTATNTTLKIDPNELEVWTDMSLQLNVIPLRTTKNFIATTGATFDFISTDPEILSVEDDGTFTTYGNTGEVKVYAVCTKGGAYEYSYTENKVTYEVTALAEVGDVLPATTITVVEQPAYYKNAQLYDDQKITLGSTDTSRIDKNDFLSYPTGDYGDANISLWYNDTEGVFTMTVDDNANVMNEWDEWLEWCAEYGITTTFISPSDAYTNEGTMWRYINSVGLAVQPHGHNHLAINAEHTTARIWYDMYEGQKSISNATGVPALVIGYANGINYEPISSMLYIGGRGTVGSANSVDKINYNFMSSFSGFSDFANRLDGLLGASASNGWISVHYHSYGNAATVETNLAYVKPYIEAGRLWSPTVAQASQYGQERDTATLTVLEASPDVVRLTVTDEMSDILFYQPLSVRVKVNNTWTNARAYQNGKEVNVKIVSKNGETYLMVDAIPDKGEVTVVKTTLAGLVEDPTSIRFTPTDETGLYNDMLMTKAFSVTSAWEYAYALQNGAKCPAVVKTEDGETRVYVTFKVNAGEVTIVPVTDQYDARSSFTMTEIYNGWVKPDPTRFITISSAEELEMLAQYVNLDHSMAGYTVVLTGDIDMAGKTLTPIGFEFTYKKSSSAAYSAPFSGTFEGNGYTISNLNMVRHEGQAAVFGYTDGATIRNLNIEGNITGTAYVGGIIGYAQNTRVSRCNFTGTITGVAVYGQKQTGCYIGGLVGKLSGATSLVENCNVNAPILAKTAITNEAAASYVGGLVGDLLGGVFNNCSIRGSVTAEYISTNDGNYVGGLVGYSNLATDAKVMNSTVYADVTGNTNVGGFIGRIYSNSSGRKTYIHNCAVYGTVTGNELVGGAAGYQGVNNCTSFVNCLTITTVVAPETAQYVGAAVGLVERNGNDPMLNVYYDATLNPGMPAYNGGTVGGGGGTAITDLDTTLTALNTKAAAETGFYPWREIDGKLTANYETVYEIVFLDKNGTVLSTQTLPGGMSATAPEPPLFAGFEFTGWDKDFTNIQADLTVTAQYKEVLIWNVTFLGKDGGETLKTEEVNDGLSATAPEAPFVEGYRFDRWDVAFDDVTSNLTVTALYVKTWKVTYLAHDGSVYMVDVLDEGTVPTLPSGPAVKGKTFVGWNPDAVPALTADVTVASVYETRGATTAVDYKVMHWTLGGNAFYSVTGGFKNVVAAMVAAESPDILIVDGTGSGAYRNTSWFNFEGYSCWAYGVARQMDVETTGEDNFQYTGGGVAVFYKTDLFTQAGEVLHETTTSRTASYIIFPLANAEGVVIPVGSAYLGSGHTDAHRATLLEKMAAALGDSLDAALIRVRYESTSETLVDLQDSLSTTAGENGMKFTSDAGVATKKTEGEHSTKVANYFYCYMLTYGGESPVVTVGASSSVAETEDATIYANHQKDNPGCFAVAYTCTVSIGSIAAAE